MSSFCVLSSWAIGFSSASLRIDSESSYPFAGDQRANEKTTDPIRFLRHLALVGTIALSMANLHQNGIVPKGILPELGNCSWLRTLARRERLLWADTVEKLDNNGRLFFCRKVKHSKLLSTLTM
jgi:hypothetical protein